MVGSGVAGGLAIALLAAPVFSLATSVAEAGIDALRLHDAPYNLQGRKIGIGQVEIGRPPQYRLDIGSAPPPNYAVQVHRVFFRDEVAATDDYVDSHAANVASVMISQDKNLTGVAPSARLFASAIGFSDRDRQPLECLASQNVALQNGGDVRAMNFSFGESLRNDPRPDARLDGNALLTLCIDWSSTTHDILYVIAGNQGAGGIPIPTDHFNGLTVTNSTQVDGQFTKVDYSSLSSEPELIIGGNPELETNVGSRRSINIVAPGTRLRMFNPDGRVIRQTGTSFAAPHVTATVALLQEFGDRQIFSKAANWSLDSRNPQVMKVVLMNSADKVEDAGDGLLLGMTRTVLTHRNFTWLDSDAYTDPTLPMSADLGTGHLNAYRAYQQFDAGQWSPDTAVPGMGWDYNTVAADSDETPQYQDYIIDAELQADSFISITLAWHRQVNLQDGNNNDRYDTEETFEANGLNDLNLYLMPADEDNTDDSIWSSVSEVDSVEHIFYPLPETGRYKIRVEYEEQVNETIQPYALAWWSKAAPSLGSDSLGSE
ncbi:MAG: S8 family serine peptidase [Cyanothece sp. SIO2G6]|nr:S8 family serine peptidase [Cyanothece sp. SIO2G6]